MSARARAVGIAIAVAAASVLKTGTASAQPACAEPTADALWAAIPEARREGFTLDPSSRMATMELDGAPPAEAVLAADAPGDGSAPGASVAWFFECRDAHWRWLGSLELAIDRAWDGTLDERPGIHVLRAERMRGVGHDLARIEHVDVRGGLDPRYVCRRLIYAHVVDARLVVALDEQVRCDYAIGPAREGSSRLRTLVPRRTVPPRLALRDVEIDAEGRRATRCRAELVLDGPRFRTRGARCGAEAPTACVRRAGGPGTCEP